MRGRMGNVTVLSLAGGAMAQLAVERCVSADLICHAFAVAAGLELYVETFAVLVVVDFVGGFGLPLVLAVRLGGVLVRGGMVFGLACHCG
jgi:hypothetical protein